MFKFALADMASDRLVALADSAWGCLVHAVTPGKAYGVFKGALRTSIGTTVIVQPAGNQAIELTDLIVAIEKKNAGLDTIRFADGTNTVNVLDVNTNDGPTNMMGPLNGRFRGWRGARLEIVQAGAGHYASICIGYLKVKEKDALKYDAWEALR